LDIATGAPYTGLVTDSLSSGELPAMCEVRNGLKEGVEKEFYALNEVRHVAHYRKRTIARRRVLLPPRRWA
jgi:antitoxin component YwqK of YwqJK toxin-antitoxin module